MFRSQFLMHGYVLEKWIGSAGRRVSSRRPKGVKGAHIARSVTAPQHNTSHFTILLRFCGSSFLLGSLYAFTFTSLENTFNLDWLGNIIVHPPKTFNFEKGSSKQSQIALTDFISISFIPCDT